ncbi:MAG: patatin-like phospholipase family protein [Arachnia sp.]
MQSPGWLNSPLFGLTPKREKVACVLSGGGSRASFQLGALDYLYRHDPQFTPTVFVGTSAGAILAAGLAQSSDPQDQHDFTSRVKDIWCGLRRQDEMFTPRPWLVRAQTEAPGWLEMMTPRSTTPDPSARTFPRLPFMRSNGPVTSSPAPATQLGPLELALQPDEEQDYEWSLGTLAQLFSNVGKLPRIGNDLLSIHQGMERTKSMYRPGPVLLRLLDPEVFDPAKVRTAGTTLRIAMVALESGALRFMTESGALVDRHGRPFDAGPHPLATGVLASCSIPAVFRPVPLGAETYVDGGVRENLPAQLAVEDLDADRSYLISAKGRGLPARQSMREADLFAIVMRSTEILVDETTRDELEYSAHTDAVLIQPELDVHGAMSVHPGLIAISIDYGWLRAAEAVLKLDEVHVLRHRRIIRLRMRCLAFEKELLEDPKNTSVAERLTETKHAVRDAVRECDKRVLPDDAEFWWSTFERHVDAPTMIPPWLPLGEPAG